MNFFNNGGGCGNNYGTFGGGCDCCTLILWLIILQNLCQNGGNGCGIDSCTLLLLLLLCGGCGNGCGK